MPRAAVVQSSVDSAGVGYGVGVSAGYKVTRSAALGVMLDATRSYHGTAAPPFVADYWAAQWSVFGRYRLDLAIPPIEGVTLMAWGFPFYIGQRHVGAMTRTLAGPAGGGAILVRLPIVEVGPYVETAGFRAYEQANTGSPSIPLRYTSVGLAAQIAY